MRYKAELKYCRYISTFESWLGITFKKYILINVPYSKHSYGYLSDYSCGHLQPGKEIQIQFKILKRLKPVLKNAKFFIFLPNKKKLYFIPSKNLCFFADLIKLKTFTEEMSVHLEFLAFNVCDYKRLSFCVGERLISGKMVIPLEIPHHFKLRIFERSKDYRIFPFCSVSSLMTILNFRFHLR